MPGTGTASLDFGAFPGASDAALAVTGQAGIQAGSLVEAWLVPTATADHSADEHRVEQLEVTAGDVVAGVGFTIYGLNRTAGGGDGMAPRGRVLVHGGNTRIWGRWSVAWAWL